MGLFLTIVLALVFAPPIGVILYFAGLVFLALIFAAASGLAAALDRLVRWVRKETP